MSTTAETQAGQNGRANGETPDRQPDEAVLPVNSYREAVPYLRRPFTARAVKFKVQACWPKDGPQTGLVVTYIDARLATDRLNTVCPHLWEPKPRFENGHLWCDMTIDGITRPDLGENYQGKGLWSDAIKRAAVLFGVGVSLYATPKIYVEVSDGHAKQKRTHKGVTLELTPQGEARCRELYQAWLDSAGILAFGQPLDHGDVEDAVGDIETGGIVVAPEAAAEAPPAPAIGPPVEAREGDAETELGELLAKGGSLKAKRKKAHEGMLALGARPAQCLRELKAADSGDRLDALITRIQNAGQAS